MFVRMLPESWQSIIQLAVRFMAGHYYRASGSRGFLDHPSARGTFHSLHQCHSILGAADTLLMWLLSHQRHSILGAADTLFIWLLGEAKKIISLSSPPASIFREIQK